MIHGITYLNTGVPLAHLTDHQGRVVQKPDYANPVLTKILILFL